jgi:hypothetical protein
MKREKNIQSRMDEGTKKTKQKKAFTGGRWRVL